MLRRLNILLLKTIPFLVQQNVGLVPAIAALTEIQQAPDFAANCKLILASRFQLQLSPSSTH